MFRTGWEELVNQAVEKVARKGVEAAERGTSCQHRAWLCARAAELKMNTEATGQT